MTQITRKSVPMRGLILLLTVTLGAGLVLTGCGDDAPATTPAPAPPPPAPAPAPEPEPMAPATPTGLHVDETTQNSITWHWTASEGALGYVVQASMDEMFDDTDTVLFDGAPWTTATEYTATDLDPETTVHVRVAAAAGTADAPLVSEFSGAVSGMSAMPPPEPTPFMASFSIGEDADSMYPMVPVPGGDEETAVAVVNSQMTVTVNMLSIISPAAMLVEGANPVVLQPGENMPFSYVDWGTLQAAVVENGFTFVLQPVTIGANQTPLPIGDPHPFTCGPFNCAEGLAAPEVTIEDSMACTMWEPTLELHVGLIDNSLDEHEGNAAVDASGDDPRVAAVTVFDGLDLGWHYTSSLDVNITHDLTVTSEEAGAKKKSSATSLTMTSIGEITIGAGTGDNDQTYYALSAEPDASGIGVDPAAVEVGSCQPVGANDKGLWSYNNNVVSRIDKPDHCFRMTVDHGLKRNYLDAYSVTMEPQGADVSWGSVAWEAWENLTCPSMTWEAMEQVDVCAMFEAEVDRLPDPDAIPIVATSVAPNNVDAATLAGFKLHFENAADKRHRFTAMWYEREKESPPPNLYSDTALGATDATVTNYVKDYVVGALISAADAANYTLVAPTDEIAAAPWVWTIDEDFDPIYGDLGKVDATGDDNPENYADNDDSNKCTADDGGTKKGASVNNGTLCNATQTIETTVKFPLGLGYGCDAVEKTYTFTCEWNARGQGSNVVGTPPTAITADNVDQFVKCKLD